MDATGIRVARAISSTLIERASRRFLKYLPIDSIRYLRSDVTYGARAAHRLTVVEPSGFRPR